jgi:hypothetical protein
MVKLTHKHLQKEYVHIQNSVKVPNKVSQYQLLV